AEGTYSLKCEGWVNGHRDETLKAAQYKITAVGYSFPIPKINVKKTEGLGPYNVTFKIDYMVKKIMGLQYRITYDWNFGDGETLTTTNTIVHHLFSKIGTYNVTMTATDQYDNTTTDNATITVGASPIKIGFKVSVSNKHMRAPLDVYTRSAIAGKTSLDRLESHIWKIDGVAVEKTKPEYLRVTFSEPGEHTVTYTATMNSGATATDSVDITVNPNQPPTCTIDHTLGVGSYVYLKAKCTDPDGRISAYKWDLDDGRGYRNGSGNISFKAPVTRIYSICLKVTDDSGEEAEFTKEVSVIRE
ncbi:MAG: PKD domain-containing protein, partial [Deltaproteobacteria bacterium]